MLSSVGDSAGLPVAAAAVAAAAVASPPLARRPPPTPLPVGRGAYTVSLVLRDGALGLAINPCSLGAVRCLRVSGFRRGRPPGGGTGDAAAAAPAPAPAPAVAAAALAGGELLPAEASGLLRVGDVLLVMDGSAGTVTSVAALQAHVRYVGSLQAAPPAAPPGAGAGAGAASMPPPPPPLPPYSPRAPVIVRLRVLRPSPAWAAARGVEASPGGFLARLHDGAGGALEAGPFASAAAAARAVDELALTAFGTRAAIRAGCRHAALAALVARAEAQAVSAVQRGLPLAEARAALLAAAACGPYSYQGAGLAAVLAAGAEPSPLRLELSGGGDSDAAAAPPPLPRRVAESAAAARARVAETELAPARVAAAYPGLALLAVPALAAGLWSEAEDGDTGGGGGGGGAPPPPAPAQLLSAEAALAALHEGLPPLPWAPPVAEPGSGGGALAIPVDEKRGESRQLVSVVASYAGTGWQGGGDAAAQPLAFLPAQLPAQPGTQGATALSAGHGAGYQRLLTALGGGPGEPVAAGDASVCAARTAGAGFYACAPNGVLVGLYPTLLQARSAAARASKRANDEIAKMLQAVVATGPVPKGHMLKQVRVISAGLQSQLIKTLGQATPAADLGKKLSAIPPQHLVYFLRSKIAIEDLFGSHVEVRLPTVSVQTVAVRELLRGQILAFRALRVGELPADNLRWDPSVPVRVAPPPPPPQAVVVQPRARPVVKAAPPARDINAGAGAGADAGASAGAAEAGDGAGGAETSQSIARMRGRGGGRGGRGGGRGRGRGRGRGKGRGRDDDEEEEADAREP